MARSVRADKIGYARVSTLEQKLDAQLDALKRAGCKKIFSDRLGGMTVTRPGWEQLLAYVRPGDTLIVTELSRMSRSLVHLLEVVKECEAREIELISLREKIDTTSAECGECIDSPSAETSESNQIIKLIDHLAPEADRRLLGRDPEVFSLLGRSSVNSFDTADRI